MQKSYFVFLLLANSVSHADTPAHYDFNNGLLTLPFVNTQLGAYSAKLQLDQDSTDTPSDLFEVIKATPANNSPGGNPPPDFNANTGLLTLPYLDTEHGAYSALLQRTSAKRKKGAMCFRITHVASAAPDPVVAAPAPPAPTIPAPVVATPVPAATATPAPAPTAAATPAPVIVTPVPTAPAAAPRANNTVGCNIFPADNVWNTPVNTLRVHSRSAAWINAIGPAKGIWADFGSGQWNGGMIGLPDNIVKGSSIVKSSVNFTYNDESDAGPYPIPTDYKIESGSDHHLLVIDNETCQLFELFNARFSNTWAADAGAVWALNNNQLRPANWTSADAAGLPIFPGLIRYDEVAAGFIGHAIRFTVPSGSGYVWPARHLTSGQSGSLTDTPPFGARFRLKASVDISGFDPQLQVILKAMQTYGIMSADSGAGWYLSGEPNEQWDNDLLHKLQAIKGSDFEAVDTACLVVNPDSGQADLSKCQ